MFVSTPVLISPIPSTKIVTELRTHFIFRLVQSSVPCVSLGSSRQVVTLSYFATALLLSLLSTRSLRSLRSLDGWNPWQEAAEQYTIALLRLKAVAIPWKIWINVDQCGSSTSNTKITKHIMHIAICCNRLSKNFQCKKWI